MQVFDMSWRRCVGMLAMRRRSRAEKLLFAVCTCLLVFSLHGIYTSWDSAGELSLEEMGVVRERQIPKIKVEPPIEILFWTTVYGKDWTQNGNSSGWDPYSRCPVRSCVLTKSRARLSKAQAVFIDVKRLAEERRNFPKRFSQSQYWVFFFIESPVNFPAGLHSVEGLDDRFNLTITYAQDSDLPLPYVDYVRRTMPMAVPDKNFAQGRQRMILWLVSDCQPSSQRHLYAEELSKHIEIDILGECGSLYDWNAIKNGPYTCVRGNGDTSSCLPSISRKYKFYFAAENSICDDYVTEKVNNALQFGLVPIVLGGANYSRILPPNSYIDITDFASPEALAAHLLRVNASDELYDEYFAWKRMWRKSERYLFENVICRMCIMLHELTRDTRKGNNLVAPSRRASIEYLRQPGKRCQAPADYYRGHADNIKWSETLITL